MYHLYFVAAKLGGSGAPADIAMPGAKKETVHRKV
jgi:hypothetical protein